MDIYLITLFIVSALSFVYGIFMIIYLTHAKKCDTYLSSRDKSFRKVALIISWIDVVTTGIGLLGLFIYMLTRMGSKSVASPSEMEDILRQTYPNRRILKNSRGEFNVMK